MKTPDIFLIYAIATIFGNYCCWHVTAFITLPLTSSSSSATAAAAGVRKGNAADTNRDAAALAAELMAEYTPAYMHDTATGSISFKPHDLENEQDITNEQRAVYDPGDELLRTLNADMAASGQELGTLPDEPDYADTVYNELEVANQYDMLRKLENDIREEQEFVSKSKMLMKLLEDSTIDTLPIVYVEETSAEEPNNPINLLYPSGTGLSKRSRYYRRYPWKRHSRYQNTYEPELRYACTPSKEDVFKLLINLHENRKGNHSKTINFCNRKRPAKAIFTNIRFLG